jgi:hypothetical protein
MRPLSESQRENTMIYPENDKPSTRLHVITMIVMIVLILVLIFVS